MANTAKYDIEVLGVLVGYAQFNDTNGVGIADYEEVELTTDGSRILFGSARFANEHHEMLTIDYTTGKVTLYTTEVNDDISEETCAEEHEVEHEGEIDVVLLLELRNHNNQHPELPLK